MSQPSVEDLLLENALLREDRERYVRLAQSLCATLKTVAADRFEALCEIALHIPLTDTEGVYGEEEAPTTHQG